MKIALITIWHEKNYGAELQAYATINVLQQLGHEVEMIDIRLSDMGKPSIMGWVALLIESISPCNRKFNDFWEKYIPTTKRYKTIKELKKDPPIADCYMVGADQVWNPDITKRFSNVFFLDFGNTKIKKVSYGSSFGTDQWKHQELSKNIKELLSRFTHITCREQSGVQILKKEFDITASWVLDPTLLLENYYGLIGAISQKQTLVYYPLTNDLELESFSQKLSNRLNLTPLNNKECTYLFNRIVWNRVSIEEWVKNIAESKFVITRSFHGMVFCLLFEKQFAVLASRNGRGIRVQDLLIKVGLSDRLFYSTEELEKAQPWVNQIDYKRITPLIRKMREESILKLREILS